MGEQDSILEWEEVKDEDIDRDFQYSGEIPYDTFEDILRDTTEDVVVVDRRAGTDENWDKDTYSPEGAHTLLTDLSEEVGSDDRIDIELGVYEWDSTAAGYTAEIDVPEGSVLRGNWAEKSGLPIYRFESTLDKDPEAGLEEPIGKYGIDLEGEA